MPAQNHSPSAVPLRADRPQDHTVTANTAREASSASAAACPGALFRNHLLPGCIAAIAITVSAMMLVRVLDTGWGLTAAGAILPGLSETVQGRGGQAPVRASAPAITEREADAPRDSVSTPPVDTDPPEERSESRGDVGSASAGPAADDPASPQDGSTPPAGGEPAEADDAAEPAEPGEVQNDRPTFNGRPLRPVRTIEMEVTAYSPDERSCGEWADGITASGHSVETDGGRLVAADTDVLPFGAIVTVPGYHDETPVRVLDRGGAIRGKRLDLLMPTHEQALQWGRQTVEITVWAYDD